MQAAGFPQKSGSQQVNSVLVKRGQCETDLVLQIEQYLQKQME